MTNGRIFVIKHLAVAAAVLGLVPVAAGAQTSTGATTRTSVDAQLNQRFAKMDPNGDGSLTRQEIESAHANFAKVADQVVAERVQTRFSGYDTNKDGKITVAELTAKVSADRKAGAGDAVAKLDANKDGAVSLAEFRRVAPRPQLETTDDFLKRFDANKDGKVTKAEYKAPALAAFDKADANKDGSVTTAENGQGR